MGIRQLGGAEENDAPARAVRTVLAAQARSTCRQKSAPAGAIGSASGTVRVPGAGRAGRAVCPSWLAGLVPPTGWAESGAAALGGAIAAPPLVQARGGIEINGGARSPFVGAGVAVVITGGAAAAAGGAGVAPPLLGGDADTGVVAAGGASPAPPLLMPAACVVAVSSATPAAVQNRIRVARDARVIGSASRGEISTRSSRTLPGSSSPSRILPRGSDDPA